MRCGTTPGRWSSTSSTSTTPSSTISRTVHSRYTFFIDEGSSQVKKNDVLFANFSIDAVFHVVVHYNALYLKNIYNYLNFSPLLWIIFFYSLQLLWLKMGQNAQRKKSSVHSCFFPLFERMIAKNKRKIFIIKEKS